jgi:hypothetical protein
MNPDKSRARVAKKYLRFVASVIRAGHQAIFVKHTELCVSETPATTLYFFGANGIGEMKPTLL